MQRFIREGERDIFNVEKLFHCRLLHLEKGRRESAKKKKRTMREGFIITMTDAVNYGGFTMEVNMIKRLPCITVKLADVFA